jgi:hypothetical protein
MKNLTLCVGIFGLLLLISAFSSGQAALTIKNQVISVSGGASESESYSLVGTMGQRFHNRAGRNGTHFVMNNGYIPAMEQKGRSCCIVPGDANGDGKVNLLDFLYLNAYLYNEPPGPPPPCLFSADANGDHLINLVDMLYIQSYVYYGGDYPICPDL